MVIVRELIGIVDAIQRHRMIGIGIPADALVIPTGSDEAVAFDGRERVVVLARVRVVETIDRIAGLGRRPTLSLVVPTHADQMLALDRAGREEVLARIGVVEAIHGSGLYLRGLIGIVRRIGGVGVIRIVGIVRLIRRVGLGGFDDFVASLEGARVVALAGHLDGLLADLHAVARQRHIIIGACLERLVTAFHGHGWGLVLAVVGEFGGRELHPADSGRSNLVACLDLAYIVALGDGFGGLGAGGDAIGGKRQLVVGAGNERLVACLDRNSRRLVGAVVGELVSRKLDRVNAGCNNLVALLERALEVALCSDLHGLRADVGDVVRRGNVEVGLWVEHELACLDGKGGHLLGAIVRELVGVEGEVGDRSGGDFVVDGLRSTQHLQHRWGPLRHNLFPPRVFYRRSSQPRLASLRFRHK